MKACTNCRGNLADFVAVCPYCGVSQPVPQTAVGPQWAATPQNSNKAIASLVCGVLFLCAPASIAAIILGHLALVDIKRSAGRMAGQGLAIAGLVMGYLGVGLTTLYFIFVFVMFRKTMGINIPMNETAAVDTMRKYNEALKAYAEKCPAQGYPATLRPLGPGQGDCTRANLLKDPQLAATVPVRRGYMFEYSTGARTPQKLTVFALVARPVTPGMSGSRYFYLDESGIIRQSPTQNVGPNSKGLAEPPVPDDDDDEDNPPNAKPDGGKAKQPQ